MYKEVNKPHQQSLFISITPRLFCTPTNRYSHRENRRKALQIYYNTLYTHGPLVFGQRHLRQTQTKFILNTSFFFVLIREFG